MAISNFKVRSTQVDFFGHLNNACYLEIYEWARWEWAEQNGMDLTEMTEVQGIGPAILHIDLSFHKELRAHEEICVRTWIHELTKVKGVVAQEMTNKAGEKASDVKITFVMFDLKARKIVPVPEQMHKIFKEQQKEQE